MTAVKELVLRNLKMFFKDKGMFFTSLITPLILLVLYATFLADVYRDSLNMTLPEGFTLSGKIIDAAVAGQLSASLLAVTGVTVAFCSNLLMIGDKAGGALKDFTVSPVKKSTLAAGYFAASSLCTLIVTFFAFVLCLVYIAVKGWYLSVADICFAVADVLLVTLFGTALSSCINSFLSTNGQASAVGTIVSSGYGFICGAYMPISNFSPVLQKIIMFLPGTYGTVALRKNFMRGAFCEMESSGIPIDAIRSIKRGIDFDIDFFGKTVPEYVLYAVLIGSVMIFTGLFVLICYLKNNKKSA